MTDAIYFIGFVLACGLSALFFGIGWFERGKSDDRVAANRASERLAGAVNRARHPEPRCPKCGLVPDCWTPMYCRDACPERLEAGEHVHWTCSRCHYGRIEKTQEQKDKETAAANLALAQATMSYYRGPSIQGPCPTCLRYGP